MTDFRSRLMQIESGGRYDARNASGAYGAYQFMPTTWRNTWQSMGGKGDEPYTPENQDKAFAHLAEGNKKYLAARLGRDPEDWEQYIAHQQGGAGAHRLLTANRAAALQKNQLANNPFKAKNVGEWLDGWRNKWNGTVGIGGSGGSAAGEDGAQDAVVQDSDKDAAASPTPSAKVQPTETENHPAEVIAAQQQEQPQSFFGRILQRFRGEA